MGRDYIALDGYEFMWSQSEIDAVINAYNAGRGPTEIAEKIQREQVEAEVLLLDQAEQGYISRPSHVAGIENAEPWQLLEPWATRRYKRWTNDEIKFLSKSWGAIPTRDIAKALKRTKLSVRSKAMDLGVHREVRE